MKPALIIPSLIFIAFSAGAQYRCSAVGEKGQLPSSAFPVCGLTTFFQDTVPVCDNAGLATPICRPYPDENPFYYKFTCYQAGTLNFLITPTDLNDDYDWQLYDVTTADSVEEIYTNAALWVTGNWSGTFGITGIDPASNDTLECFSDPYQQITTFCRPPILKLGHKYLLLVSHYLGGAQSGYSLAFSGGTASITDTARPHVQNVFANCDASQLSIKFNKGIICSSLATDGSDFSISPPVATVTGVSGINCATGFDMDSAVLTLSQPLPPGSYSLVVKNGNDGNTLLDACSGNVPAFDTTAFAVLPPVPTLMDSITVNRCGPKELQLVFRKKIQCSSIDADGSDFVIKGPTPVTVTGATGNCGNGLGNIVTVSFSSKMQPGASYQVKLVKGNDGNTLTDECGQETPAGQTLGFTAYPGVYAAFNLRVMPGCKQDTVVLAHDGANSVNTWKWVFDDGTTYTTQNVTRTYNDSGPKKVLLTVANQTCQDTASQTFMIGAHIAAGFSSPVTLCPQDAAVFKDSSLGNIVAWLWDFGNGNTSTAQNPPPQTYSPSVGDKYYAVQLVVNSNSGCSDSVGHKVKVLPTCYITVPNAFTPNGDGRNDYLGPLNAYKAANLEYKVFNRLGQLIFETKDWTHKWDGTVNGKPQSTGAYIWTLAYTNTDTGQKYFLRGTTVLIR